jgi:ParB-like chromosome segregation protein Spo0J
MPMASSIELWPLDKLIPYARNARTHSDAQVAQFAASIKEFGFVNPILAGTDCIIIAGHGRLLAARKLGMTEVPVIVLDGLNENQRRAFVLADNKLALNAGWDDEPWRLEIEGLRDADYDLNIIGFEDDELARLLVSQDANGGLTDEDAVPELQEVPIHSLAIYGDLAIIAFYAAMQLPRLK